MGTPVEKRYIVALLAEGVDRNVVDDGHLEALEGVALLAEGVDRNMLTGGKMPSEKGRPPRGGRG